MGKPLLAIKYRKSNSFFSNKYEQNKGNRNPVGKNVTTNFVQKDFKKLILRLRSALHLHLITLK